MDTSISEKKTKVAYPDITQGSSAPLKPRSDATFTDSRSWGFTFADHKGYERQLDLTGVVNSNSTVLVSICELGVFGGQLKPFQGAASMEVHNVVPHDNGIVVVRGYIGWESDLTVQLSVFVV